MQPKATAPANTRALCVVFGRSKADFLSYVIQHLPDHEYVAPSHGVTPYCTWSGTEPFQTFVGKLRTHGSTRVPVGASFQGIDKLARDKLKMPKQFKVGTRWAYMPRALARPHNCSRTFVPCVLAPSRHVCLACM